MTSCPVSSSSSELHKAEAVLHSTWGGVVASRYVVPRALPARLPRSLVCDDDNKENGSSPPQAAKPALSRPLAGQPGLLTPSNRPPRTANTAANTTPNKAATKAAARATKVITLWDWACKPAQAVQASASDTPTPTPSGPVTPSGEREATEFNLPAEVRFDSLEAFRRVARRCVAEDDDLPEPAHIDERWTQLLDVLRQPTPTA